eukprot:TRINITY_DN62243_c0_g1_i1.p1 TRINITY_DN62243_c0_g1~~TRINITY_DN62243_c0_g1_i1.p1  ORF type:complete len:426 (-),score=60.58 TRINITY_DN62243_c0_g1_i1:233-1510(-)
MDKTKAPSSSTKKKIEETTPPPEIQWLSFGCDSSKITVGTPTGCKVYSCYPFGCYADALPSSDICIATPLTFTHTDGHKVPLVCVVTAERLDRVLLWNMDVSNKAKKQKLHSTLSFSDKVLNVVCNHKRLVVVMEHQLHIFSVPTFSVLGAVDTAPNPNGLVALSLYQDPSLFAATPNNNNASSVGSSSSLSISGGGGGSGGAGIARCNIAYPFESEGENSGGVLVLDATQLQTTTLVKAHRADLQAIALSQDGTLLAAGGVKGMIKIYNVARCMLLHTLNLKQRSPSAMLHNIGFSPTGAYVCASISGGSSGNHQTTVHIYQISEESKTTATTTQQTPTGVVGTTTAEAQPTTTEPKAPHKIQHLKWNSPLTGPIKHICGIQSGDGPRMNPRLTVATSSGALFQVAMDWLRDKCTIQKEYKIGV